LVVPLCVDKENIESFTIRVNTKKDPPENKFRGVKFTEGGTTP